MGRGRSFQREGAAAEKALSPQVRRLVLMVLRVFAPADLRQRVGAWRGRRPRQGRRRGRTHTHLGGCPGSPLRRPQEGGAARDNTHT